MTLWFVNRGSGVVLVALLTLATTLGVLSTLRAGSRWWPRFATQTLHRNVSLLALALLGVHLTAPVLDDFVELHWYSPLLPVGGGYAAEHRTGMVAAAVALWCLLLVTVTSLLRHRLPHRFWRTVHLLTYLAWALGVLHGVLMGTDTTTWWGLGVTLVSVAVVAAAVALRLWTWRTERRRTATAAPVGGR